MISVAMCTYNGERYVEEQLNSIINQTMLPDEIVVCDDGSVDETVAICQRCLAASNIKYRVIVNENNLGFVKNFEKSVKETNGDIIFLSDQDDVWKKDKIATVYEAFNDPNILLTFHDAEVVNKELKIIVPSFWSMLPNMKKDDVIEETFSSLLAANYVQGSATAFRRELLEKACPFPSGIFHDEWLALIALGTGGIKAIPIQLMKYRQSDYNVIGAKKYSLIARVKKYILSLKIAIEIHKDRVANRCLIFKTLAERNIQFDRYLSFSLETFLQCRLNYIVNVDKIPQVGKYFSLYCRVYAVKELCKDILAHYMRIV